jgi:hypothetical protein
MMALSERKVSKVLIGRLSGYSAEVLRLIKVILGV